VSTPVGHSLLGGAILKSGAGKRSGSVLLLIMAVLAYSNLPDIDLFFGALRGNPNLVHHQWTHSLFFCLSAGMVSGLVYGIAGKKNGVKTGLLLSLILISHLLLDMLTKDSSNPFGIQLLWPVSRHYFIFPFTPLPDVYKASSNDAFFRTLFSMHNLKTVGVEIVVCAPLLLLAIFRKKRVDHV